MTKDDEAKPLSRLERLERAVFPAWVFEPGKEEDRRLAQIGYSTASIAIIVLAVYAPLVFALHYRAIAFVAVVDAVALAGILLYHRRMKGTHGYAREAGVAVFGSFCLYLGFFNPLHGTAFVWIFTFPLITMSLLGSRRGAVGTALFLLTATLLVIFEPFGFYAAVYPVTFKLRFMPALLAVSVLSYLYERNREQSQQRLNAALTELSQSKEAVERQVQDRTTQLNRANEELLREVQERRESEIKLQAAYEQLMAADRELREQYQSLAESEGALRESEEKYRILFENSTEAIFVAQEGKLAFVNPMTIRMTGYSAAELASKPFTEFIHPDDGAMVLDNHIRRLRGEHPPQPYAFRLVHPDGNIRWMEVSSVLIDWEGKAASLSFMMDITARKRAEDALTESRQRLADIIEFMPDATLVIDRDGKVIAWNRAMEALTGIKAEEILSKGNYEYALPFYGDRRPMLIDLAIRPDPTQEEKYTAIRRSGDIIFGESYTPNLPGGETHLSGTASVLRDSRGEIIAAIECIRNNTERKKLEAQLLQAQKMEAIGTLAGGIAHDFNNLLMAIQGNTSLALMITESGDPRYEKLKAVEEQVMAGADLTKQLLGFARIGKYEMKPIDLNGVVEKSSAMFGRTKKEILIHEKYEPALWAVEADATQMEQVLLNLYVNAWQAMPGGGHVYLETANMVLMQDDVRSPFLDPGRYVKISVTDTGVGMDEKTKERIFEPFFTTKEMGRGTGLGLAMVYGIIKGHHGHISVYSERDKGTTFNIYLPASEKGALKGKKEEAVVIKGHETILLVDDEEAVLSVIREILKALEYKVLSAVNGREALKIYEENSDKIALVILDMIMPEMGGGEVFDRLKEINPEVKVLLSSGYSLNGEAAGIMARGCQGFIQKPVRVAELSQKVRNVLGESA